MAAIVGVDARIDYSTDGGANWDVFPERNEFTITISVDVAERRPFVASLADAWVKKARTWMNWNGSMRGFYDDADDNAFDMMKEGDVVKLRFYDSRAVTTKYWEGDVLLTNVDHSTGSEDFSTLDTDFEGTGALARVTP